MYKAAMHGGMKIYWGRRQSWRRRIEKIPLLTAWDFNKLWNPVWQIFTGLCRNIKCNPNIFAASYNSLKWYENRRIQQALLWSDRCLI